MSLFYKLTGRNLILPWMFNWKQHSSFGNQMEGIYGFRFFTGHSDGTMWTKSYKCHIIWNGRVICEPSFCWRPDVTHYWLMREPNLRKKGIIK